MCVHCVTGVEREVHNVLYAECMESKGSVIYAEPSIPGIDYRDPEVASNQLPPNNATLECNGSNREYAQLNHVTGSNGHMGSVSNPGYCSTQPHALQVRTCLCTYMYMCIQLSLFTEPLRVCNLCSYKGMIVSVFVLQYMHIYFLYVQTPSC